MVVLVNANIIMFHLDLPKVNLFFVGTETCVSLGKNDFNKIKD